MKNVKYKRHGMHKSRTHKSWDSAIRRCHWVGDPSFHKYGAVGIAVCDRWRASFLAFLADMGERPEGTSLDRIDNTKGYEPSNCRWSTPVEQARNRKSTLHVTVRGERVCFMDACKDAGLQPGTVRARLRNGYTHEMAFSLPVFKGGKIAAWKEMSHET